MRGKADVDGRHAAVPGDICMSDGSSIEWLAWPGYRPASWNPAKGCTSVSEGCRNCYAEVMAARFSKPGQWGHGIAEMRGGDHRWTGRVGLDEAKLLLPLRWRSPRVIFVNSTSDLFHERLPDEAIDRVFAVMALCPQHRFICLTKRAERMLGYFSPETSFLSGNGAFSRGGKIAAIAASLHATKGRSLPTWPLPNVILGVSVEDQETADERIPHLLATQAACRMVSAEPLLGAVDFTRICILAKRPGSVRAGIHVDALSGRYVESGLAYHGDWDISGPPPAADTPPRRLHWVVSGGESGPGARPAHPDWFRSIRDQCRAAEVPFFFKQNGEYAVVYDRDREDPDWQRCDAIMRKTPKGRWLNLAGGHGFHGKRVLRAVPVGKHRSGRLLDGRTHDEVPEVSR